MKLILRLTIAAMLGTTGCLLPEDRPHHEEHVYVRENVELYHHWEHKGYYEPHYYDRY